MVRRIFLRLCLVLAVAIVGNLSRARAQQDAQAGKHTPQQIAAAKKLATEIGGRLREDAQGNVIALDMAAGRTWADDYQMEQILVFPKLAMLVVEGPGITNQLIPRIVEQRNLTSLTLKNTLVDDEGAIQLTGLKALKVIDLRVAPLITDRAMESLIKMPNLRAVRLVGGNITDQGVVTLLQSPLLSELDVRNCRGVTKTGIKKAAAKESLRTLKLGGPTIDDAVLDIVADMKHLTSLSLENGNLSDAGVAKLGRLSLKDLFLYQCPKVTDQGLAFLANYKDLQQLSLQDIAAKGAALAKLPNPEKLVALSMSQSGITDAEVPNLAKLSHLESLNLSQTAITDASVDTIAKLTSLKRLVVTQTHITNDGANRLRKALPGCAIRAN